VLSLFPGLGLFDRAFEEEGFCVVRGPDLLWGGDIHDFHPPEDKFDGIIGGPPCPAHSTMKAMVRNVGKEPAPDLIPEFVRCVLEAQPDWFVMENVAPSPVPEVAGYAVHSFLLNNRWLGEIQNRLRRFSFGIRGNKPYDLRKHIEFAATEAQEWRHCVRASGWVKPGTEGKRGKHGCRDFGYRSWRAIREACELQGLPSSFFDHTPLTLKGAWQMLGNGVPLPMGQAIAKAIKITLLS